MGMVRLEELTRGASIQGVLPEDSSPSFAVNGIVTVELLRCKG
jgi:hypothetical protein